jgi:hypothetical protein
VKEVKAYFKSDTIDTKIGIITDALRDLIVIFEGKDVIYNYDDDTNI